MFVPMAEDTATIYKNKIKLAWKMLYYRLQSNLQEIKIKGESCMTEIGTAGSLSQQPILLTPLPFDSETEQKM